MKKNYTKPLLTIEMFSMTQTTARDCADNLIKDNLTLADITNCGYDIEGTIVFLEGGKACTLDGELIGFACYHNPDEGNYIFRS